MSVFSLCALASASAVLIIIVKQFKSDIAVPVSVCITSALSIVAISLIEPICAYINELTSSGDYGGYVKVMMKSLGIALVSSQSADICRDIGEGALASKVELVGKCAVMLSCLPLIGSLIKLAEDIMYA